MKILEVGNVVRKVRCSGCQSKLECDPSDVELEDTRQFIICPICNQTIYLTGTNTFPIALVQKSGSNSDFFEL